MFRHEVRQGSLRFLTHSVNGWPQSIAFLSLCVLAALGMQEDEEHAANNYYNRLAAALDLTTPQEIQPVELKQLWLALQKWLHREKQIHLPLPEYQQNPHHIVAMSRSQTALRKLDLRKLPDFFTQFAYLPQSQVTQAQLCRDLMAWSHHFTHAGQQALQDAQRRQVALAQVMQELAAWDGTSESGGVRRGLIELELDFPGPKKPHLYFKPHRPPGFPDCFPHGLRTFEAGEEGWYDSVVMTDKDGHSLRADLHWPLAQGPRGLALFRKATGVIAFGESPFVSGYLSRQGLALGLRGAVLCRVDLKDKVRAYLQAITAQTYDPIDLLAGWNLFFHVCPLRRLPFIEDCLKPIDVETTVQLIATGGLRAGRNSWLAGAPPRLFIAGDWAANEQPTVNQQPVKLNHERVLLDGGLLAQPGKYEIAVGGAHALRLEIVAPQIAPDLLIEAAQAASLSQSEQPTPIVLPAGQWTLLGAASHEVLSVHVSASNGCCVCPTFRAVWAVSRQSKDAQLVCLTVPPPRPSLISINQAGMYWANTILAAASASSRMGSYAKTTLSELRQVWRQYVAVAAQQRQWCALKGGRFEK